MPNLDHIFIMCNKVSYMAVYYSYRKTFRAFVYGSISNIQRKSHIFATWLTFFSVFEVQQSGTKIEIGNQFGKKNGAPPVVVIVACSMCLLLGQGVRVTTATNTNGCQNFLYRTVLWEHFYLFFFLIPGIIIFLNDKLVPADTLIQDQSYS